MIPFSHNMGFTGGFEGFRAIIMAEYDLSDESPARNDVLILSNLSRGLIWGRPYGDQTNTKKNNYGIIF